jgi:hypothetical protein
MARDCPRCGLTNPTTAHRCDCGYDFSTGQLKESYLTPKQRRVGTSVAPWLVATATSIFVINVFSSIGAVGGLGGGLIIGLLAAIAATYFGGSGRRRR